MNALELADLLETTESTNNQAAAMLRQQQAELDRLKKEWDYWYTLAIERGKAQK
jgi:hypothetical protein